MTQSRREFLKRAARGAAAAGVLAGGALLVLRDGGQPCTRQFACAGCGAYAGCSLPEKNPHPSPLPQAGEGANVE